MLHVKEEAKKEVSPRDFWIAIGIVAVLLCALGIYTIQRKHVPGMPSWFFAIPLGLVWASAIINLVRRRSILLGPMYLLNLIGVTLFATAKLAPQWWRGIADPGTAGWFGSFLVVIVMLSSFIGIGKKQPAPKTTDAEPERIAAR